jgi:hypothetical protein
VPAPEAETICRQVIAAAAADPFLRRERETGGTDVLVWWSQNPVAGSEQDLGQFIAAAEGAARAALVVLPAATPLTLPAEDFHPSADSDAPALAATTNAYLPYESVLLEPSGTVDLSGPDMAGLALTHALCWTSVAGAMNVIVFGSQHGNATPLGHAMVDSRMPLRASLFAHPGVLFIGQGGEAGSLTSVHSASLSGAGMRAVGRGLDFVIAALWAEEKRRASG